MLSELQLRSIAKDVGVGISVLQLPDVDDPETWVITFNNAAAAEASQAPIEHLQGEKFLHAFPEVRNTPFIEWYQQVARTQEPLELPEITYGDELIPTAAFRVVLSSLPGGAVMGQYINVTQQRRAEGELRQMNAHLEKLVDERTLQLKRSRRLVGEISQAAAHELRSPLRRLLLEATMDQADDPPESLRPSPHERVAALQLLQSHLDALLRYTSFDPEASPETFDPASELAHILQWFEPTLANVTLSRRVDVPLLTTNKKGFIVICEQLVSNALTYRAEAGAEVGIELVATGRDARLTVSDNGIGIPEEAHDEVFRAFRRLNPYERYPGAGVGLAMCRDVVEVLKGSISIDSAPGKGAKFRVTLPNTVFSIQAPTP